MYILKFVSQTNDDRSLFTNKAKLKESTQTVASSFKAKERCLPCETYGRIRVFCTVIIRM